MTNADLVWHLVELLLKKETKDQNQVALDKVEIDEKPNDLKQDET